MSFKADSHCTRRVALRLEVPILVLFLRYINGTIVFIGTSACNTLLYECSVNRPLIRITFTLQEATVCFSDDEEEKHVVRSQKDKRCAGVGEACTCDHTHITTGLTS